MKKNQKIHIYLILLSVAVVVGIASWGILQAQEGGGEIKRILIKPHSQESGNAIRGRSDLVVRHEFDDKFTAEVPATALAEISTLADVSEVVKLELLENAPEVQNENAICGDGIIDPQEKCGETGLQQCTDNKVCWDCKCVNPNKPVVEGRLCLPTAQREYNVVQVNGGQPGDGREVKIAVVDTGANVDHLDLDIKACKDMTQLGMRDGCTDENGHGTSVTGTAGASGGGDQMGIYGVAPGVELWVMKVCDASGNCYDDDIAEGIRYAAKRGANIINISLGNREETPIIKEQIDAYPEVLFVAAAGNSGPRPDTIYYPAAYKEVVAVAFNDKNKIITWLSSRGISDGNDQVITDREVEFTAGGMSVQNTYKNGCYARYGGTSMASPVIAGVAAKVWQGSASATRAYLRTIAQDITQATGGGAGPGYDIASGYGLPVAP